MIYKLIPFLLLPFALFAQISEVASIREVETFFENADASTLAVFDIDDTLLLPVEPALQERNRKKHIQLHKELIKELTLEQLDLIGNLKLIMGPGQLIEEYSPAFIQNLQKRKVPIIALTAVMGQAVNGHYMPEARCQELKRNGFDFSSSFSENDHFALDNINPCFGSYPVFYKGVLCSNGDLLTPGATSKGDVLAAFLRRLNWTPKKVIFVDDREYNLVAMEKSLKEKYPEIVFQGLRYSGSDAFPSPIVSEEDYVKVWRYVIQTAENSIGDLYNLSELVQFLADAANRAGPTPIFAIGGRAGVGKTTLAQSLSKRLKERGLACAIIPLDHFNLSSEIRKTIGTEWDIRHLQVDRLHHVLSSIAHGQKILEKPTNNQLTGETGTEILDLTEQDLILFEGIYALGSHTPLNFFDYCFAGVYLTANESYVRSWKWARELKKLRPRTPEQFESHMQAIADDFEQNVSYTEKNAHFILKKNNSHGYLLVRQHPVWRQAA